MKITYYVKFLLQAAKGGEGKWFSSTGLTNTQLSTNKFTWGFLLNQNTNPLKRIKLFQTSKSCSKKHVHNYSTTFRILSVFLSNQTMINITIVPIFWNSIICIAFSMGNTKLCTTALKHHSKNSSLRFSIVFTKNLSQIPIKEIQTPGIDRRVFSNHSSTRWHNNF